MYRCYAPISSCKLQEYHRDSEGQIESVYCKESEVMSNNFFCEHSSFNRKNRPTLTSETIIRCKEEVGFNELPELWERDE